MQPRRSIRTRQNVSRVALAWGLGVSLFIHAVVFTSVTYFGQVVFGWFLILAIIGSLSPLIRHRRFAAFSVTRSSPRNHDLHPASDIGTDLDTAGPDVPPVSPHPA